MGPYAHRVYDEVIGEHLEKMLDNVRFYNEVDMGITLDTFVRLGGSLKESALDRLNQITAWEDVAQACLVLRDALIVAALEKVENFLILLLLKQVPRELHLH